MLLETMEFQNRKFAGKQAQLYLLTLIAAHRDAKLTFVYKFGHIQY